MEVFWNAYQDRVIDIALNVAGYVLAGCLWLLVYSSWQARKQRSTDRRSEAVIATPTASAPTAREGRRTLEFVSLRTNGERTTGESSEREQRRGRNRVEVFAMARKLLADGASADSVKSALPISDGELALLDAKKDN